MREKNWLKFTVLFGVCLLFRLLPLRAPNVEPILATQMPISKIFGALAGFLFGLLSIVTYDLITAQVGLWTLVTSVTYGFVGLFSTVYFQKFQPTRANFLTFAVLGTLFYDAVTGIAMGPLLFNQSFSVALAGQIPFTALHLAGSMAFAWFLSPAIYYFVKDNKKLQLNRQPIIINKLNFKKT